ncbi:MAG: GNAT family N-acetyltransferase [Spirochaetia bacterium]
MKTVIDGDTIEIRGMRADEAEKRLQLQFESYREYASGPEDPKYTDPETHGRLQRVDPSMEPRQNRLLFCNGRLASSVSVYLWHCRLSGLTPKAGLIGGVCTHPDFRRRGFVRMLMGDVLSFMKQEDCSLSWLYGKNKVYGSSGYREFLRFPVLTCRVQRAEPHKEPFNIRPTDRFTDIPEIKTIYESWNRGLSGPMERSKDDWMHRVLGPGAREGWDCFSTALKENRIIGYYQLLPDGSIGEFGADSPDSARLLLESVAEKTKGVLAFNYCFPDLMELCRSLPGAELSVEYQRHGMWQLFRGEEAGLPKGSGTDELLKLLEEIPFVYYRMDRF